MTYGQDSTSANYEDSGLWGDTQDQSQINPQQAQQAQQTQESQVPAFDPNKFVPIEKFQQVEQELNQLKPTFERLQSAFNPNQQSQLSPEEKATQDFLNNHFENQAKAKGFATQADIEAVLNKREVESWSEQRGIGNFSMAEKFYGLALEGLQYDSVRLNNPNLANIANNMASLAQAGRYKELTQYIDKNLPKEYWYTRGGQPQAQTVGQSFSNQPFGGGNELTPENFTAQVTQLQRAGKWQEAQALQQRFAQQIKSIY